MSHVLASAAAFNLMLGTKLHEVVLMINNDKISVKTLRTVIFQSGYIPACLSLTHRLCYLVIVWPEGSYCILANGSCPKGFDSHRGHLRSLYLYSSHPQFVGDSKFGNSSMGCFGSYCGEFGNFIGALTLVTCCK